MSMILKCQHMAVALLMSIVMVITGKELFKTSCVDSCFGLGFFWGGSDPSRVLLFFYYFDKFCIWHRI